MRNFIRNELPWLLLSLTFAVVLWLYFTGQNVQPRDITAVPVFSDSPRNLYVDRRELPSSLVITVEATAAQFQLIERGNSQKVTVAVDLTQIKAGPNEIPISLEGTVTPPFPRNIRNPKPSPGSVKITAVPIRRRDVPVRPPDEAHVLATYLQPTGPWEITPPTATVEAPEDRIADIVDLSTRFVTPDRMIADVDNTQILMPLPPPDSEEWFRAAPERFAAHLPVEIRTKSMSFFRDVTLLFDGSSGSAGELGPPDPVALDPPSVRVTLSFRADRPDDRLPVPADVTLTAEVPPGLVRDGEPVPVDVTVASEIPGVTITVDPPRVNAVRLTEESWTEMNERRAEEEIRELTGDPPAPGQGGTVPSPGAAAGPAGRVSDTVETPGDITRPAAGSGAPGREAAEAPEGAGRSGAAGSPDAAARSGGSPSGRSRGTGRNAGPAGGGAAGQDSSPPGVSAARPPSVPGASGNPRSAEAGEESKAFGSPPAGSAGSSRSRGRGTGPAS